jgi:hypothetical protein
MLAAVLVLVVLQAAVLAVLVEAAIQVLQVLMAGVAVAVVVRLEALEWLYLNTLIFTILFFLVE